MKIILIITALLIFNAVTLNAKSNYSCLKSDGDWLDGVSKKQCKSIGGKWMKQI